MLTTQSLEAYALSKNEVVKEYPFDDKTAVFKVAGKMFLLFNDKADDLQFNVKCDPLYALELRSIYTCVNAGYHMNKKHWNTIIVDGSIEDTILKSFVDDSYDLIVQSLPKKIRERL